MSSESSNLPIVDPAAALHADHRRSFADFKYVYPVLSRRARGLSLGINLNPDKVCNFDCIYCQVDRRSESETQFVDLAPLLMELEMGLSWITSGKIYEEERFAGTPVALRRLNDIAFSGDGEPTTFRNFDEIVRQVAEIKSRQQLADVKLVLITNASMFHRDHVQRGLAILDANNGEIWAKLDAGTAEYYHLVDRTTIPFQLILDNITAAAKVRPIVIQSLFMRVNGEPPTLAEQHAFCDRLNEIIDAGGQIKLVQVYTVARRPAESYVGSLTNDEVDALAELVRTRTKLAVDTFYGSSTS